MNILSRSYEIIKDAPKEIAWEDYETKSKEEFYTLLSSSSDNEAVFQNFFEENPSYMPGALELFGQSGHYPFMHSLVSQPRIGSSYTRIPDFVWLAQNSLDFSPVFVEIEKPSKLMFNKSGSTKAEFTQAIDQIYEWKSILKKPANQLLLFDFFNIPQEIREKNFKPQFLLIYGRREEYENKELLRDKRATMRQENIDIMSFDRLRPIRDYYQFITSTVWNKEYRVKSIAPTFKYRPDCAQELASVRDFKEAIKNMRHTSPERKEFLEMRYDYWVEFSNSDQKGLIHSGEGE
ncbi:Shedu anti-phage system protein SduA domain-containing protein [Aureibacillus halotolerans]|uniref:Uncharacterized protein DUF4263 n=1 Tax=Aureibacillus halotolerans TaxID=1508390 RepID=A0A4R6TZ64_9BACI|nr:Shedu anti-phage system protein SduA domain-containing protein [Aureibacillus halotolerans]TDQ38636.1 uncharacterized protein DUF4263 [Aureibacillus halotolerans]